MPSTTIRLALFLLTGLLLSLPMRSHAIEEPAYEVVRTLGDTIEVRQYAAYVVAEVLIDAPADQAGNTAFPILAGYIFGKNRGALKLEMTAPVTQTERPTPASEEPVKLEMTAPVTQIAAPGGFVVQFVLPKDVTLATAPEPLDPRVKLREVPATRLAAIRYSGFWSATNYDTHLAELKAALEAAGLAWSGEPVFSRFNGPFTPWFLRRNEIWLRLE